MLGIRLQPQRIRAHIFLVSTKHAELPQLWFLYLKQKVLINFTALGIFIHCLQLGTELKVGECLFSVHFVIEYFLEIIFSHVVALLLTLARQGACRELDDSAPRPLSFLYANLCLYLCLTIHINGTVWVRMFIYLFIGLEFLSYIWVLTDFVWQCWGWLQHKLKRLLLQGMDCQMEHGSHLSILTSTDISLLQPWKWEWRAGQFSLQYSCTALLSPLIKHISDIFHINIFHINFFFIIWIIKSTFSDLWQESTCLKMRSIINRRGRKENY